MDRKQEIELIIAMLQEVDDKMLHFIHVQLAGSISNLQYVTIYDKIDEKYKRAASIEAHVKEAVERIRMREDWKD